MDKRLKKVNIAGRWYLMVGIEMHGESSVEVNKFLMEVVDEITHEIRRIGRKKDYKVNVKGVDVNVKSGI